MQQLISFCSTTCATLEKQSLSLYLLTVFTCATRNLDIHIPAYMITISIPFFSDYCISFMPVIYIYFFYSTHRSGFQL